MNSPFSSNSRTHNAMFLHLNRFVCIIPITIFLCLYSIWALPGTILIRNICLIIGAIFGVFQLIKLRILFASRGIFAIYWLLFVFVWAGIHLILLSQDYGQQLREFESIWKRAALGTIFGIGLGLCISKRSLVCKKYIWIIFYISLGMPTIIYFIKYFLTNHVNKFDILCRFFPDYLYLYYSSAPHYVPKVSYIAFCCPILAISFFRIYEDLQNKGIKIIRIIKNIFIILAILILFYIENIKNGYLIIVILTLIFCIAVFVGLVQKSSINFTKFLIPCLILAMVITIGMDHVRKNIAWKNLVADSRVALQVDHYQQWKKYDGSRGYPKNEYGVEVFGSTYERIAWARVGIGLIPENPLGFGLIERSFGSIAKREWPKEADGLHQTHSGWIDLTLGIGLPGALAIVATIISIFFALMNAKIGQKDIYQRRFQLGAICIIATLSIAWLLTELSQKVYFEQFLFFISMAAGFGLKSKS